MLPATLPQTAIDTKIMTYIDASIAPNTRLAYKGAITDFTDWMTKQKEEWRVASPDAITGYLYACANGEKPNKVATMRLKLAAISKWLLAQKLPDYTKDLQVKQTMRGIAKTHGKPQNKKAAITLEDLAAMLNTLDTNTLEGLRNRAILLIGFQGAFRRSELVAIDIADIHINGTGFTIMVNRSKTDQEGNGQVKHFPKLDNEYCAYTALRQWLDKSNIQSGKLFRSIDRYGHLRDSLSDKSVALIVKSSAKDAGLSAIQFSGHSMRIGFITTAYSKGIDEWKIQEQTGHKSLQVMRGYNRMVGNGARSAIKNMFG